MQELDEIKNSDKESSIDKSEELDFDKEWTLRLD